MGYSDFEFKTPNAEVYNSITPGTVLASKAVITDASNKVDTLDITTPKFGGTAITSSAVEINKAGTKASTTSRLYNLGAPALADDDLIVTTTDMIAAAYFVDAQPDVPRNITVSATAVGAADTLGTISVVGTNYDDEAITEVITPVAGNTVAGLLAFKTVVSVTGVDWVIGEGNDTIIVGTGNEIGLPILLDSATEIVMGVLGTTITATNPTVATPATLEGTTIDMSSGIYNGTKEALVFIVD